MATEVKDIKIVVAQQGAEKTGKGLDDLTKAFQELMDKARKANPSLIAVENRLKYLKNAMVVSKDATVELRNQITTEIKVLNILRDELQATEKAERARGKSVAKSEEELDAAGRASMERLRGLYTSIEAVDKELSILTIRMAEARKESALTDLQFNEQLTTWAQTKHELIEVRREYQAIESITKEVAKAAEDAAKAQVKAAEEAAKAQDKQANSLSALIKKGILWAVGTASMYYLWRKIRTAIIDTIKELYEETEQYKALTDAMNDYRRVATQVITTTMQLPVLMDALAKRLVTLTQLQALWGANLQMIGGTVGEFINQLRKGEKIDVYGALTAGYDAAKSSLIKSAELMAIAGDEAKDYSSQISSLVSQMRTFNEAAAAQAQAIREIEQAFKDATAVARGQYAASLMQIEIDLQKQVSSINKKALESRAKAYEDYQDKIKALQRDGDKARQNDAERHALEMEFAQRRHNLSLIQNERMYQYSRGMLVAEGDVLAIEDLDARYALEKQAAEENFALQQQQAEAMFRLQAKIQSEAMRDQVAALQLGLREQLAEIEAGRREEIAEAQAAAQEKEAQAADEFTTRMATAIQERDAELKAQEEGQIEREKSLTDFLLAIKQDTGMSFEDILNIGKQYFDVGGSFDSLMKTEWERQATYVQVFTNAINTAINAITVLGNRAQAIGGRGGVRPTLPTSPIGGRRDLYAHGTDTIISSPTNIGVGERGPERVIVQPLSPIGVGGNVSMSWRGGPIPIHGTGTMGGIDEGAIGNAIAQGIVDQMALSFSSIRGSRGN